MKKITAAFLAILCLLLTGCSENYAEKLGSAYGIVTAARESFDALSSAHLTVTDNVMGIVTTELLFRYEGENLTYFYRGSDGEKSYKEYNNGIVRCIYESGTGEWQELFTGDENFYCYTREVKFPYASKKILFFEERSVISLTEEETEEGKAIRAEYDVEALNQTSKNQLGEGITFTSFSTVLYIDQNGYPVKMTQTGATTDGRTESALDIVIEIDGMNGLSPIEKDDYVTE